MSMVDEEKTMKTVSEINKAILSGNFSPDDIRSIQQALKAAYSNMQTREKFSYRVGEEVTFKARSGEYISGKITKINQKTINVRTNTGMEWKVSPSLLKKVRSF